MNILVKKNNNANYFFFFNQELFSIIPGIDKTQEMHEPQHESADFQLIEMLKAVQVEILVVVVGLVQLEEVVKIGKPAREKKKLT